jgi:hypothetical protein
MSATPRFESSSLSGLQTGVSDVLKFCNSRTGSSNRAGDFRYWPFCEVSARPVEVRKVGYGGLDLLTLSSSHFDPQRAFEDILLGCLALG